MLYQYQDARTGGVLRFIRQELRSVQAMTHERQNRLHTIAWNTGDDQRVHIDGLTHIFPGRSVLPVMMNQTVTFENPEVLIAWQFDREFYCIVDHDQEVSCTGFLFFGPKIPMFVQLTENEWSKFDALLTVFDDECATQDPIQGEMLRMLLKRLIIKLTRLAKAQHLTPALTDRDYDLVRRFNLLVEIHFRNLHTVSEYADLLNKSPKTLANLFATYRQPSPLQLIHARITLEAKRLLLFTDKSAKEIAFSLGFTELPHFSRFFKKQTGLSASEFRTEQRIHTADFGKN